MLRYMMQNGGMGMMAQSGMNMQNPAVHDAIKGQMDQAATQATTGKAMNMMGMGANFLQKAQPQVDTSMLQALQAQMANAQGYRPQMGGMGGMGGNPYGGLLNMLQKRAGAGGMGAKGLLG